MPRIPAALLLALLLSSGVMAGHPLRITTVAGGGPNNIPAVLAHIDFPRAVARDPAGALLIATSANVYKVDSGGLLTVIAGNGSAVADGDGGPATAAGLGSFSGSYTAGGRGSLYGLAVDPAGDIFISDAGANQIRRVAATTGIITTYAGTGVPGWNSQGDGDGGPAVEALLVEPQGIALDGSGNLYIADTWNFRVRRVDAASGVITTVPGTSGMHPEGIVLDDDGNLLIADTGRDRVFRLEASTQVLTTVAGGGVGGDGGPAVGATLIDPAALTFDIGGNLFIAERGMHRVRRVDAVTGIISTAAGTGAPGFGGDDGPATNALLRSPSGLGLDATGSLLIADTDNHRIRRVDAVTNILTTVAGSGDFGDGGPATMATLGLVNGIARDAAGNLFIVEGDRHRVRRVNAATGNITTVAGTGVYGFAGDGGPATSAMLAFPTRLALDGAGNLFIADVGNWRVRRVDGVTGIISTVAGPGSFPGFGGEGVPAVMASFDYLRGVAADAAGNLFIADGENQLDYPYCNEDPFGNLPYLCGNRIRRVDAATGIITTVAGGPLFGTAGDGWPADRASFYGLSGLSIDAAGNLYIGDSGLSDYTLGPVEILGNRIRRIDAVTGIITTIAGNGTNGFNGDGGPATAANISVPTGFALDAQGSLFFIDSGNNRVRRIDAATGIITTVAGDGVRRFGGDGGSPATAGLNLSGDLVAGAPTQIFIADTGNRRVRLIEEPNNPPQAVITGGGLAECTDPQGHLFHLDGSQSTDADSSPGGNDDIVTFEWFASFGTPAQELLGTGPTLDLLQPAGEPPREVTLRVVDTYGEAGTQSTSLAVQDTAPPQLTIASVPDLLWPPNHRLVDVAFSVTGMDQCGPASVTLAAVTSSEADDAPGSGDGTTTGDIQGADVGTTDFEISLRAERDTSGAGRVYTVSYVAVDASGNAAQLTHDIIVPHDKGGVVDPVAISLVQDSRGTVLEWSDVPGALFYTVVRGDVGLLREVGGHIDLGTLACIEAISQDTDTHESPDRDDPGPGGAYFYLVEYNDGLRSGLGEERASWPRELSAGGCP